MNKQIIARGALGLITAGIVLGLSLIQVHASYPWHNGYTHMHWLPLLWVLIVYGVFFVLACLAAILVVITLMWCWEYK